MACRQYENITEITRLVVVSLIERINVYEDAEIEVVFRQKNQFEDIMQFLNEQGGEFSGARVKKIGQAG